MTNSGFDEIGLSYAKNFDEVEAARTQFERQSAMIMDRLVKVATRALATTQLGVVGDQFREDGWDCWWIAGSWQTVRKKSEPTSGICFGLGHDQCFERHDGGRFGFGAYAFFVMSERRYNRIQKLLADAAGAHGCVLDYVPGKERSAYMRTAWILPKEDQFRLDVFEKEVERLPALFSAIDQAVGTAYALSNPG